MTKSSLPARWSARSVDAQGTPGGLRLPVCHRVRYKPDRECLPTVDFECDIAQTRECRGQFARLAVCFHNRIVHVP